MSKKRLNKKTTNQQASSNKRESVQLRLFKNRELSSKVDNMLDKGYTLEDIQELCKEYDFDISIPSLSRYNKTREECIKNGWDMEEYLDKRKKNNVVDIKDKEVTPFEEETHPFEQSKKRTNDLYDDIAVLDEVIKKGAKGLNLISELDPSVMMKAIELKHKITDGQLQGMSLIGLRELQLKQTAKETAMTETMLEFIPEEQHEQVLQRMQEVESEFYKNLDLDEEDRKLVDSLERIGYSI